MMALNFETKVGTLFNNPIFTASGCAGSGKELSQFFDLKELGAIVTKSIMLKPRSGRATPRMAETPSGMLNSIGLQGPGIDLFLEHDVPWLRDRGVPIIVSIAGETVEEYAVLARKLRSVVGVVALEVNISCPNVENRGQVFACSPVTAKAAIEAGAGDIGMIVRQDPSKMDEYIKVYQDIQPVIDNDLVTTGHVPFTIVHQWDRVPAIKELVMKKYG